MNRMNGFLEGFDNSAHVPVLRLVLAQCVCVCVCVCVHIMDVKNEPTCCRASHKLERERERERENARALRVSPEQYRGFVYNHFCYT